MQNRAMLFGIALLFAKKRLCAKIVAQPNNFGCARRIYCGKVVARFVGKQCANH